MLIRTLLIITSVLMLTACNQQVPANANELKCIINGTDWVSSSSSIDESEDLIKITAENQSYRLLMSVNNYSVNDYSTSEGGIGIKLFDRLTGQQTFVANFSQGTGIIEITSITNYSYNSSMSGTFSFVATNIDHEEITVTDGVFTNVPIID